jgi:hypothetical protein
MNQKFLKVTKYGQDWFEFPADNEVNVRAMLMKEGVDAVCEIVPVDNEVKLLKVQEKTINMTTKKKKNEHS